MALSRLSFVILLALIAVPAAAQTDPDPAASARIRIGPVALSPGIALQDVGIDSNVFNETVDPKQDFTATLRTQLQAWLRLGRARFSAVGNLEGVYFKEYTNQRSVNGGGTATLELLGNRVGGFVGGSLNSTRQRPGFEIDLRARQVHKSLEAGGSARLSGKTSLGLTVDSSMVEFDDEEAVSGAFLHQALNRRETTVTAFLEHQLTPLTSVQLRADVERDTFDLSPLRNARRLRITPAVQFKPFALISGSARIGYQKFEPEDGRIAASSGAFASVDLQYTLRERTRLAVQAGRDVQYSIEPLNPYYVITGMSGSIYQALSTSWGITVRGGRQYLNYQESALGSAAVASRFGDTDTINSYGAGLVWRVNPDMQVGVNADYQDRRTADARRRNYEGLRVGSFVTYGMGGQQ